MIIEPYDEETKKHKHYREPSENSIINIFFAKYIATPSLVLAYAFVSINFA